MRKPPFFNVSVCRLVPCNFPLRSPFNPPSTPPPLPPPPPSLPSLAVFCLCPLKETATGLHFSLHSLLPRLRSKDEMGLCGNFFQPPRNLKREGARRTLSSFLPGLGRDDSRPTSHVPSFPP